MEALNVAVTNQIGDGCMRLWFTKLDCGSYPNGAVLGTWFITINIPDRIAIGPR